MNEALLWIIPPLAGAIIGYVTNAIAIKMLFRPLNPVRIFGWRLPFTPGILPRQRHKLAVSIGGMVERELLTPAIIRERLLRDDVRQAAQKAVAGYTARLLDAPLADCLAKGGEGSGASALARFFAGPGPARLFQSAADAALAALFDELQSAGEGALGSLPLGELLGPRSQAALDEALERMLTGTLAASAPLIAASCKPLAGQYLPRIAAAIAAFLKQPAIHAELEVQGRDFLDNAIRKLSSFQRFFISAGQYDRTLREKMPEIVDDMIAQVEEAMSGADIRARISAFLSDTLASALASPEAPGALARAARTLAAAQMEAPLSALTGGWDAGTARRVVREWFEQGGGGGYSAGRLFERAWEHFLAGAGTRSLGALLGLEAERKEGLDAFITDKLLAAAGAEIQGALETVNIRATVSDRIDALDMLRVERIILDIMAHQLKYINVFGGILGALIGAFQSLFTWLTR